MNQQQQTQTYSSQPFHKQLKSLLLIFLILQTTLSPDTKRAQASKETQKKKARKRSASRNLRLREITIRYLKA